MMMISHEAFHAHVAAHAGIPIVDAPGVTHVVLSGLAGWLEPHERAFVASELPPTIAAALDEPTTTRVPLVEHVVAPGRSVGQARELVASVCRVLVEELSIEAVDLLRARLPALAAYLAAPDPASHGSARPHRDRTLAAGAPGSEHPICDAPSRATDDSVAAANPHGATKLSSSRGTTQERHHDTLAEGHVRTRPISRGH